MRSNAQIFLCHSHSDKPFVRKLAGHLSELDIKVWLDEWELKPGDSLHGCIEKALQEAAYLGVILSPESVASKWCQNELTYALSLQKHAKDQVAIPLLVRDVLMPLSLSDRLFIDFRVSYFSALTMLAGFIHKLPNMELTQSISRSKPRNMDHTITHLENAGWNGIKYMEAADFEQLQELLKKAGVDVESDQFDVVVQNNRKLSRKSQAIPQRRKIKK